MSSFIKVNNITVNKYRIFVLVQLGEQHFSNIRIKEKLLLNAPNLAYHKCKNKNDEDFVDVMDKTSLAHLLEHLIIDFQIQFLEEDGVSGKPIFGTTEWIDQDKGLAKVEVSFYDDIIALKAIKSAEKLLNECLLV